MIPIQSCILFGRVGWVTFELSMEWTWIIPRALIISAYTYMLLYYYLGGSVPFGWMDHNKVSWSWEHQRPYTAVRWWLRMKWPPCLSSQCPIGFRMWLNCVLASPSAHVPTEPSNGGHGHLPGLPPKTGHNVGFCRCQGRRESVQAPVLNAVAGAQFQKILASGHVRSTVPET